MRTNLANKILIFIKISKKRILNLQKVISLLNQVIETLSLPYSQENLKNRVSISGVQDTIIIKLSIVTNDQQMSKDIANEMVKVMQEVSGSFEGFDNIEILDEAQFPLKPSGPNRMLYVTIGIIIGGITGVGVIFVFEMIG